MNRRRSIRDERGQSMVEFVLVLPLLCMLVFGIVQFGILYNNYITITDAARVGARKGAVSRTAVNPEGIAEAAARSSASSLNQTKLDVIVTATAWAPGGDITVETSYPYDLKLFGMALVEGDLTSKTTERVE